MATTSLRAARGTTVDVSEKHMDTASTQSAHLRPPLGPRGLSDYSYKSSNQGRVAKKAFQLPGVGKERYFRSRRIGDTSSIEKPWLTSKDPRREWHTIIPIVGVVFGLALVAVECYQGWTSVMNHDYCMVYSDDFSSGRLNSDVWTKEVQVGGFGNGNFEQTTNTDENVFIPDGELHIKPTLQDEALIYSDNVLNLTESGLCTGTGQSDCVAVTNTTNGTIVNPVKSGRITTKKGATIQYCRVEVEALLPEGDWLWPAIWLLPVKDTYGEWPTSGEINIAEFRGNNHTYPLSGNDVISSTLHWGPGVHYDAWYKTYAKKKALHTTYSKKYHTFGLEWSEKYLFTYINSRLVQANYISFDKPRYPQGNFQSATSNGTRMIDPWRQTGRSSTPFDQPFYLILNVAVGATNGWFKDGVASEPRVDAIPTAKKDFWDARYQWYPTWNKNPQMKIKGVKMWQQAGYQGCKVQIEGETRRGLNHKRAALLIVLLLVILEFDVLYGISACI